MTSPLWEDLGRPRWLAAPMVDLSAAAFRALVKQYDVQLTYTPMFHARLFGQSSIYRAQHFDVRPDEGPVIVQFAGDDPEEVLSAAREIQHVEGVAAVDLNFGCPQGIAKRGSYGAYLLDRPELMCSLVSILHHQLDIPVTCKMRKVEFVDPQPTVNLALQLEAAGAQVVCVHGRTKEEKGGKVVAADMETVKLVKQRLRVPVVANGNVETRIDAEEVLQLTGADAVMSAEGLLSNPALFSGRAESCLRLAYQYIDICETIPTKLPFVRSHLFRILNGALKLNPDVRSALCQAASLEDYRNVVRSLEQPTKILPEMLLPWYRRHWQSGAEARSSDESSGDEMESGLLSIFGTEDE